MEEKYEKSADSIRAQILEDRGVEEKEEAKGGGGARSSLGANTFMKNAGKLTLPLPAIH